jgi:hypothetical protein
MVASRSRRHSSTWRPVISLSFCRRTLRPFRLLQTYVIRRSRSCPFIISPSLPSSSGLFRLLAESYDLPFHLAIILPSSFWPLLVHNLAIMLPSSLGSSARWRNLTIYLLMISPSCCRRAFGSSACWQTPASALS